MLPSGSTTVMRDPRFAMLRGPLSNTPGNGRPNVLGVRLHQPDLSIQELNEQ